jgi:hypothetical protein
LTAEKCGNSLGLTDVANAKERSNAWSIINLGLLAGFEMHREKACVMDSIFGLQPSAFFLATLSRLGGGLGEGGGERGEVS